MPLFNANWLLSVAVVANVVAACVLTILFQQFEGLRDAAFVQLLVAVLFLFGLFATLVTLPVLGMAKLIAPARVRLRRALLVVVPWMSLLLQVVAILVAWTKLATILPA